MLPGQRVYTPPPQALFFSLFFTHTWFNFKRLKWTHFYPMFLWFQRSVNISYLFVSKEHSIFCPALPRWSVKIAASSLCGFLLSLLYTSSIQPWKIIFKIQVRHIYVSLSQNPYATLACFFSCSKDDSIFDTRAVLGVNKFYCLGLVSLLSLFFFFFFTKFWISTFKSLLVSVMSLGSKITQMSCFSARNITRYSA